MASSPDLPDYGSPGLPTNPRPVAVFFVVAPFEWFCVCWFLGCLCVGF